MSKQYEITYTFFGKERPVFSIAAENQEDAISKFRTIKPAVPASEILHVTELPLVQIDEQRQAARIARGRENIDALTPEAINEQELVYIQSVVDDVKLRFSWPSAVHDSVLRLCDALGIPMPDDARPMDSGKFGGKPMYSLSTELSFPAPSNPALIPDGGNLSPDGKRVYMSRVTYSLGLRKAGIPVNVYAK